MNASGKLFTAFSILALATAASCSNDTKTQATTGPTSADSVGNAMATDSTAIPMVGSDVDAHGCKGSAGYTWSSVRKDCIQLHQDAIRLEDQGENGSKTVSAFVVVADDDRMAELFYPGAPEPFLMKQVPDSGAGTWRYGDYTLTQWKGMYTLELGKQTIFQGHQ